MRRSKLRRAGSIAATYLLVAALAVLGWLWHSLPAEILLEPGQTLTLPRFAYVQPLRTAGSRNAASTQAAGSYQATLSIGGWLPVKTVRALVETRPVVTVCGTPFGVKMFSEGALIVGFSDLNTPDGTANPAKKAGLRLGDRVIRMGNTVTETNEQVHAALEAAAGAAVEVVYVRKGEQRQTTLLPVWDTQNAQWRAGMWVRDSSAGVGTLTFVDAQAGVFAGLGHPISDSDTGERVALRSGEIVACQIVGCTGGTAGAAHDLAGHDLAAAQGNPLASVTVADGVTQPGEYPGLRIHKGQSAHPGGGIPHPHSCPPLGVLRIPHRQKGGLPLLPLADVDHLHRRTGSGLQRGMDLLVGLGNGVPHADHPVAQPQPGLLGGVCGAVRGVQVGKAHNERTLGEHLNAERRTAHGYHRTCFHQSAHSLDGQPPANGQSGLIAARSLRAGRVAGASGAQRLHIGKTGQGKGLAGFQQNFSRQTVPQPAQHRQRGHQKISCRNAASAA